MSLQKLKLHFIRGMGGSLREALKGGREKVKEHQGKKEKIAKERGKTRKT